MQHISMAQDSLYGHTMSEIKIHNILLSNIVRPSVKGLVFLLAASREYSGWLKAYTKVITCGNFRTQREFRRDQIAGLIKELYILNRCTVYVIKFS